AVAALLTVLAATADGLDGQRALMLLTGPIGRVDPISLRQLRRVLPRTGNGPGDQLAAVLNDEADRLPAGHARALRRVRAVLAAAARSDAEGLGAPPACGGDPHRTLWQAWNRSGLQRRWLSASERGGPAGARAGRDLDAVTALFDIAEQYVSRTPGGSLSGLIEHVHAMQLPAPRSESALDTEAVSILSAHAALGREWDLVVIAGLQEGLWPNTVPRGGVLHTQRLIDTLDGIGAAASVRAPVLAEERRLLVAAMGRARRRLLVTAIDSVDDDGDTGGDGAQVPSGFFTELLQWDTGHGDPAVTPPVAAPPVLSTTAVVGRLRGVVCAPDGAVEDADRTGAAAQLARLARAGVRGADPADWHGMTPVSTDAPLWRQADGQPVTLSPSSLETLTACPLRWLMERHGGSDGRDLRSTVGSVLHALIAQPGKSQTELLAELDRVWSQLPFASQWYSANELERHRAMLEAFSQWRDQTRDQLTEVGVEVAFDGAVDGVRVRGRIDRLERDAAGRLMVVDVKTGKTPVSKDDAQRHAQLATYQLAVEAGLVGDEVQGVQGDEPGGGLLVYLGKPAATGPTERHQDPMTPATGDVWREEIARAAAATAGPVFPARVNDGCRHCLIRPFCPAHAEGTER
ncbi:MAG: PD-(D/E)XK nuclease family protein, partial [Mycobacterium sp.]